MWSSPAAFEVEGAASAQAFAATGAEAGVRTPSDWSSRMQADPNMLSELLLGQQRMNMQLNMQLVQLLAQGLSQQNPTSAPAAPRRKSRNKAPRPQKAERERRRQAWIMATTAKGAADCEETENSQEAQGDVAAPPQPRSDAESWIEVDTMATKAYVDDQIRELKLERDALAAELADVRSSTEASISDAVEGAVRKLMDIIEKGKAEMQAQMKTMATRDELAKQSKELSCRTDAACEQLSELNQTLESAAKLCTELQQERATSAETVEQTRKAAVDRCEAVAHLTSEHRALQAEVKHAIAELSDVKVRLDESEATKEEPFESKELVEQLNQLQREKDELAARLADVRGSMQKSEAETADEILQLKTGRDGTLEQLSQEMSEMKHTVGSLNNAVARLTKDEQFSQFKLEKDANMERVSSVPHAAVKDAVSALTTTIHSFNIFACLDFEEEIPSNPRKQQYITVTLLRSSDGSTVASAPTPCKFSYRYYYNWGFSHWIDDTEALHQCVTRLMASKGAAGLRWAYFTHSPLVITNLSYICIHLRK
mmetsp:Transcript_30390/g.66846  ORF Transcript_30390/g.66846 Transcript_30390/m.66846 type:complete len:542 (-) Transcript_30390:425-2050(-)